MENLYRSFQKAPKRTNIKFTAIMDIEYSKSLNTLTPLCQTLKPYIQIVGINLNFIKSKKNYPYVRKYSNF